MVRGRRTAKREAAQTREVELAEAAARAEIESARRAAEEARAAARLRTDRSALDRLSTLSR